MLPLLSFSPLQPPYTWRYLSLGCHHQDSYVKKYRLLGVKKSIFWGKKILFQGFPVFIPSSAASISFFGLSSHRFIYDKKNLLVGIKKAVFGQKEISFKGLPNFILSSAASINLWAFITRIVIVNENKVAFISCCWHFVC